jgi:hypothetical protein
MCYYYDRPNLLANCLIHVEYAKKRFWKSDRVFWPQAKSEQKPTQFCPLIQNNLRQQICNKTDEYVFIFLFLPVALRLNAGHGLLILEVSRSHTTTHHDRNM